MKKVMFEFAFSVLMVIIFACLVKNLIGQFQNEQGEIEITISQETSEDFEQVKQDFAQAGQEIKEAFIEIRNSFASSTPVETESEVSFPSKKIKKTKTISMQIEQSRGYGDVNVNYNIPVSSQSVTARVYKDDQEQKIVAENGSILFSFPESGKWEIDTYDRDGIMMNWYQVEIY